MNKKCVYGLILACYLKIDSNIKKDISVLTDNGLLELLHYFNKVREEVKKSIGHLVESESSVLFKETEIVIDTVYNIGYEILMFRHLRKLNKLTPGNSYHVYLDLLSLYNIHIDCLKELVIEDSRITY